jgi:hypothetical protein
MWYYEEKTALGRWSPRTEPGQPSAVTASGNKRNIRAVREVPENMTGYDLNVLRDWSDAMIAKETAEALPVAGIEEAGKVDVDFSRARVLTPAAHLARQAGKVERVRHIKRGSTYRVVGRARMQVSIPTLIVDDAPVVVYRGEADGQLWARLPDEFDDPARFERLDPAFDLPRVKPLQWREIDPGHRFVGTGLGFTCEVRWLHMGGYEAIWPQGREAFFSKDLAVQGMQDVYADLIHQQLEGLWG